MLGNLPDIKHHTTNLLVASSVNAVARYLLGASYKGRFPEKTRIISDGISNGILCNAAINFADSFIYETSLPIFKAATLMLLVCVYPWN
ncbi:MAG: 2-phosphosulfolactate phosphatase [Candidatus Midichloria mitochondrii]|uniref:Uncharacterized protein n=1 Tax=Midichloria mitochondrii (strain IricVA) TaxID=696127 RepID=F7XX15_MIDMI|nr:hypothetical protein [Candidatus Midichloria mitochondrii]AEI89214.1 hypothetical protein midi_00933 [Candidatus Midichloria mitochondrii IricVA]MDJ1256223.1 hypothetical protein [Candidatus Midichloria mitochondrii]MDJ1288514.1 hypothetical protein [Candidatus Midichloria mitochondrii]MDJ1299358.1 hypothetical protein [Candidatus Midichloria mitochondrii]MDJ1312961.1 hypothetical protein [Candidatus Midichloria mitochondrii]